MRRHLAHDIGRKIVGASLVIVMMSSITRADQDWLTEPERALFEALGVDARVNGKPVKRSADLGRLPEIAGRAPQPLRGRIEAIARATERMRITPEERSRFAEYLRNGQQVARRQLGNAMLGAVLGDDPMRSAVRATNGMMREGNVAEAWKLQRQWLERGLAARQDADSRLTQITSELQRRVGKSRPDSDLALRIVPEGGKLCLEGKAGSAGVGQPILQVTLYKKSTKGQWTGLNVASGLFAQAMGVDAMDLPAQGEGGLLAAAQERRMNLPMMTTLLLPSIDAGGRVDISLGLPTRAALGIEHVEARLWSSEGWFAVEQVPGLSEARRIAMKQVQDQRSKAQAARQAAGPFRPRVQPSRPGPRAVAPRSRRKAAPSTKATLSDQQKARSELSLGKSYLRLKKIAEARKHLENAVKLAPGSDAAREAQGLLDSTDK